MYPILIKCLLVLDLKFKFAVTAFKKSSTNYSESVPVNTMSGLSDVIDDSRINYGFSVI